MQCPNCEKEAREEVNLERVRVATFNFNEMTEFFECSKCCYCQETVTLLELDGHVAQEGETEILNDGLGTSLQNRSC